MGGKKGGGSGRRGEEEKMSDAEVGMWVGGGRMLGGPLGHEIKKKMQRDTKKINRDDGLTGLVSTARVIIEFCWLFPGSQCENRRLSEKTQLELWLDDH